jgi:hypothetical protein
VVQSSLRGDDATALSENYLSRATASRLIATLVQGVSEDGPAVVVWLVDRSPSCREMVADLGRQISQALEETVDGEASGPTTLLHAVGAFGQDITFVLDPPSPRLRELSVALESVPPDESGREVTFAAVKAAVERYLPYRTEQGHYVIVVVISDEAGDDDQLVDEVAVAPREYGIPIYAVSVPAPFGRPAALASSVEAPGELPTEGNWRPLRQGPESRALERLQLGFWAGSSDLDLLDSGFGPFGLERLCRTTGGDVLALRPSPRDAGYLRAPTLEWPSASTTRFDPQVMRRYAPDYVSQAEYERLLATNKARRALHDASRLDYLQLVEFPRLEFVKRSEAELAKLLSSAQQVAARLEPAVGRLYETLADGEDDRDSLTGRRWQAAYDLALGRAAAARVRIEGYNAMLAALKRGKTFENPSSSRWVLEPAETMEASSALQRIADQARECLDRVIADHPSTPWALIAKRERETPIGWRWTEK